MCLLYYTRKKNRQARNQNYNGIIRYLQYLDEYIMVKVRGARDKYPAVINIWRRLEICSGFNFLRR